MRIYKTQKGYYYKEYSNGKKKRISKENYLKMIKKTKKNPKKSIMKGGAYVYPLTFLGEVPIDADIIRSIEENMKRSAHNYLKHYCKFYNTGNQKQYVFKKDSFFLCRRTKDQKGDYLFMKPSPFLTNDWKATYWTKTPFQVWREKYGIKQSRLCGLGTSGFKKANIEFPPKGKGYLYLEEIEFDGLSSKITFLNDFPLSNVSVEVTSEHNVANKLFLPEVKSTFIKCAKEMLMTCCNYTQKEPFYEKQRNTRSKIKVLGSGSGGIVVQPEANTSKLKRSKVYKFPHSSHPNNSMQKEYNEAMELKKKLTTKYDEHLLKKYFLFPEDVVEISENNYNEINFSNLYGETRPTVRVLLMNKGNMDLYEYFTTQSISMNKYIRIIIHVLEGVKLAVDAGIALFDLKLENIIMIGEIPFIIDFDKMFIPTNWDEFTTFITNHSKRRNNYLWPPEFINLRDYAEEYGGIDENTVKKQFKLKSPNKHTWIYYINKAMVYLISNLFKSNSSLEEIIERMRTERHQERITLEELMDLLKQKLSKKNTEVDTSVEV